jgi:hypothetical protein
MIRNIDDPNVSGRVELDLNPRACNPKDDSFP